MAGRLAMQTKTARLRGPFRVAVTATDQLTLIADHAAATALYCAEPVP